MHSRFQAALTTLAADLQAAIAPMLADPHFPALLEADQVATLQHATGLDEDALAFALLPLAAACARPDLSHFNVGAIARGVSGRWYFGGNMEFLGATMQQTVHAEQSAISHASAARRDLPARYHGELHAVRSLPSVYERTEQRAGAAHSSAGSRSACPGALSAGRLWPERPREIKTLLMDEQDHGFPVSGDALTRGSYSGRQPLPCALQPLAFRRGAGAERRYHFQR